MKKQHSGIMKSGLDAAMPLFLLDDLLNANFNSIDGEPKRNR